MHEHKSRTTCSVEISVLMGVCLCISEDTQSPMDEVCFLNCFSELCYNPFLLVRKPFAIISQMHTVCGLPLYVHFVMSVGYFAQSIH